MNPMIKAGLSLALACALTLALAAEPAPLSDTAKTGAVVSAEPVLSKGVVKKVDKTANKITIQHGEILNLGMMPMTMMFRVKDPAMLEQVQVGQTIHFHVDIIKGVYTVLRMEPV